MKVKVGDLVHRACGRVDFDAEGGRRMRIGELAEATATSRRLLRYYEQQGLIVPARAANGYRDYDPRYVDRVMQIRGLLEAGLPTRIIKQILPCLDKPRSIHFPDATPQMLAMLEHERDQLTRRIAFLTRNRNAMTDYLAEVRRHRDRSQDRGRDRGRGRDGKARSGRG